MKVCIFRASDGACDYYRTVLPMIAAARNGEVSRRELWMPNLLSSIMEDNNKFVDAMSSDIYFLQRVCGSSVMQKIKEFARDSKLNPTLIMDYDDDVFNVSPLSAHYVDYGVDECKIVLQGKVMHEWKNGINIDIQRNRKRLDEIKKTLGMVDVVTVTTDILANVFKPYNNNVKVLPNCVDINEWDKLSLLRQNRDEIRICWSGGHSHFEDLLKIRKPLINIAKKYSNVKIIMVGYMPNSMANDFRPGQLEFHEWKETPAHPYRTAALDIDIALIPLCKNEFSSSKSAIKWIEFASLKVPSVTSYVTPYKEIEDKFPGKNGLFIEDNDENGWFEGMEILISNTELRKSIGENARKIVEDNFDINKEYKRWVKVFKEASCQLSVIQP